jgi:hypothetical protein
MEDWRGDWPDSSEFFAHPASSSIRRQPEKSRSIMTEPSVKCWFRPRPANVGKALAGPMAVVLISPGRLFQRVESSERSTADDIGLIIAIVVAAIVGLVLLTYLVRPLIARKSPDQPAEPAPASYDHDERWARWEADNAGTTTTTPEPSNLASHPVEDVMIGTLPEIDLPREQVETANERAVGASLYATVSALIGCANDGAMLSGFGLYSDRFFHSFAMEAGLSLDEFVRRYQNLGARPESERLHVERIENLVSLPDGRIAARVVYGPAGALSPERYIFVWSSERNRWLIDDITAEP